MTPYAEVPCGTKRPDLVGVKKARLLSRGRTVAVELKNSEAQLRRGLDQMTTFAEYVNEVWLACTPLMAAEYLHKHTASKTVRHWDPEVLNRKRAAPLLVQGFDQESRRGFGDQHQRRRHVPRGVRRGRRQEQERLSSDMTRKADDERERQLVREVQIVHDDGKPARRARL
jgi:hypothetical protein